MLVMDFWEGLDTSQLFATFHLKYNYSCEDVDSKMDLVEFFQKDMADICRCNRVPYSETDHPWAAILQLRQPIWVTSSSEWVIAEAANG